MTDATRSPEPRLGETHEAGFSIIELLTVVVILAILASIAMFRMHDAKQRAHDAAVKQDLKNLVTAQEAYYDGTQAYASDLSTLSALFSTSDGVIIEVDSATDTGWGANGTHQRSSIACQVAVSNGATGIVTCERE